ncbi:MAG: hypothetical protein V1798_02835 [Pseudomonadota bacterium]
MSDQENLELIVRKLAELYSGMRDEQPSLDVTMGRAIEAIGLHRRFRAAFETEKFDARWLVRRMDGSLEEEPFDWKALDTSVA